MAALPGAHPRMGPSLLLPSLVPSFPHTWKQLACGVLFGLKQICPGP